MRGIDLKLSLRLQLVAVFTVLALGGTALVVLDELSQRRTQAVQAELKDSSLAGLRRLMAIADAYGVEMIDSVWKVSRGQMGWQQASNIVDSAALRAELHWRELARQPRNAEQGQLYAHIAAARIDADRAVQRLRELLQARDTRALSAWAGVEMYAALDPVTTRLRYLSDLEMIDAERLVRAEDARLTQIRFARIGIFALVLALTVWIGRDILRNVYRGVESLVKLAASMQRRDFERSPGYRPRGELGQVMDAFLDMRAALRANETELRSTLQDNEAARRQLQQRDLFQRSLLSAAQIAILSVDANGRYTHVNPFAERLLGYPADRLIGVATPDLLHDEAQIGQIANELTAALDRGVPRDWRVFLTLAAQGYGALEWTLKRGDGSQVPVLQAVSAMHADSGELLGLLFVATDLTELKKLEDELRRSESRAQEASRAKSAFVAAMSHEIRTPMIGVTGMVEVLSHTRLDEEQRRSLNIIQHSAENLLQIIGDILDFSKIEADKLELAPVPTALRKLVMSSAYNFLGSASSKGLQLEVSVDDSVSAGHLVDPTRFRQIINNFLSNAIKFTEKGRIDVRLRSFGLRDGRESLQLEVQDSGIGISEEAQRRLFQPFTQAESSTARRFGGTGLGLTIARRLAELMGGQVSMESVAGRGTTMRFNVALPLAEVAAEPESAGVDGAAPDFVPRPLPTTLEAERERSLLLLVDDHPTNRLVVSRQLGLAGFRCETAVDGEEGLAQWKSGRFALVLSDVHMPKMDGYEMTRAIRTVESAEGRPHTPILALTAAAMKGEAERCLDAGMDDYMTKPVSIPTLVDRLHKWLPHIPLLQLSPAGSSAPTPLPQANQPAPLEASVLAEISGGDPATERAILADFLDTTLQDLREMARAQSGGDAAAVGREAHKIKGAAKLVGASEIADAALILELAGKRGDLTVILQEQPGLVTAVERLKLHLTQRYAH